MFLGGILKISKAPKMYIRVRIFRSSCFQRQWNRPHFHTPQTIGRITIIECRSGQSLYPETFSPAPFRTRLQNGNVCKLGDCGSRPQARIKWHELQICHLLPIKRVWAVEPVTAETIRHHPSCWTYLTITRLGTIHDEVFDVILMYKRECNTTITD